MLDLFSSMLKALREEECTYDPICTCGMGVQCITCRPKCTCGSRMLCRGCSWWEAEGKHAVAHALHEGYLSGIAPIYEPLEILRKRHAPVSIILPESEPEPDSEPEPELEPEQKLEPEPVQVFEPIDENTLWMEKVCLWYFLQRQALIAGLAEWIARYKRLPLPYEFLGVLATAKNNRVPYSQAQVLICFGDFTELYNTLLRQEICDEGDMAVLRRSMRQRQQRHRR